MGIVVMVNGEPEAPFAQEALKKAVERREIARSALAQNQGQQNWRKLQNMPERRRPWPPFLVMLRQPEQVRLKRGDFRPALRLIPRMNQAPNRIIRYQLHKRSPLPL
jgi:hypothetical protein